MAPTKNEITAASAGWVAVTLNVLPGLGTGYLYQRRWKAYWTTAVLATTWFTLGAVLGQGADGAPEIQEQMIFLSVRLQQIRLRLMRSTPHRPLHNVVMVSRATNL